MKDQHLQFTLKVRQHHARNGPLHELDSDLLPVAVVSEQSRLTAAAGAQRGDVLPVDRELLVWGLSFRCGADGRTVCIVTPARRLANPCSSEAIPHAARALSDLSLVNWTM